MNPLKSLMAVLAVLILAASTACAVVATTGAVWMSVTLKKGNTIFYIPRVEYEALQKARAGSSSRHKSQAPIATC